MQPFVAKFQGQTWWERKNKVNPYFQSGIGDFQTFTEKLLKLIATPFRNIFVDP